MPVGRTKPRSLMPRSRLGCKFKVVNDKAKFLAERSGVLNTGTNWRAQKSLSPVTTALCALRRAQGGLRTALACRNCSPRFVLVRSRGDQGVFPATSGQRDLHPGYPGVTDRITVIAAMRTSARS